MAFDPISPDPKELERALRQMPPAGLTDDFLDRLELAADGSLVRLTESEIRFESSLRSRSPADLDPDLMKRLEGVVAGVQFPVNDKIVLFPKTAPPAKPSAGKRPMWAAAAAVALIGGISALMLPAGRPADSTARQTTVTPVATGTANNFRPAGFNTAADTEDVGVSWHPSGQPHRVYRLTFRDLRTFRNAEGKTIEVEQPRTEYILVPEKMD